MLITTPIFYITNKIKIKVLRRSILHLPSTQKKALKLFATEGIIKQLNTLTAKGLCACIVPSVALPADGLLCCAPKTDSNKNKKPFAQHKIKLENNINREGQYCTAVVGFRLKQCQTRQAKAVHKP